MIKPALFLLAALALAAPSAGHAAVRLNAPPDLTVADPAPVRLLGLPPGARVEMTTLRRAAYGPALMIARAVFTATGRGEVDVSTQAPVEGGYGGVDKAGLFWSAVAGRAAEAADPARGEVAIEAHVAGRRVARAVTRSAPDPAGLVVESAPGFPGAVFAHPPGPGRRPTLIVLGGSEGGAGTARAFAPLFAARGYAVLGLPYYDPGYDPSDRVGGLPTSFTEIPVDRLEQARAWLAARPEVDAGAIGVWGASKGAEFALIAAAHDPAIRATAAIVPSDVVWEGWGRAGPPASGFSLNGAPLPFVPYEGMAEEFAKAQRGEPMQLRRPHMAGRLAHPDRVAAARIPVEAIRGPVLVAGGGLDRVWPSSEMAQAVADTRRAAGLPTTLLVFPDAGHALGGTGYDPAAPLTVNGGEPAALAHARAAAWRATLAFFSDALRPPRAAGRRARG